MATWKPWQLDDPLMSGPEVAKIQRRLIYAYPKASQAVEFGVRESGVYDAATAAAVTAFQNYVNLHKLSATRLRNDGVADYATKVRLGVVIPAPVRKIPIMTVPGTVAHWNQGPPAETAWRADPNRFRQQGVGFSTDAFLMGDPTHSYIDARGEGVTELLRLSAADPGPQIWVGYSMGADVVVRALHALPADRRADVVRVITFGSPGRPPGPTLLDPATDPGGAGIAGVFTPEWARSREYSFTIDGDMYAEATGLLPTLYEILTRLEATGEFALYLFQVLLSNLGGPLLGLVTSALPGAGALAPLTGLLGLTGSMAAGGGLLGFGGQAGQIGGAGAAAPTVNLAAILFNIPAIIQTLLAALKFVQTNAHYHYSDLPIFGGMTAVDRAAAVINSTHTSSTPRRDRR